MKILINDKIAESGINALKNAGFEVISTKVAQDQLTNYINKHQIEAVVVRSATQIKRDLIEACPSLKLIARAGVGTDNIDLLAANEKGIKVINTPFGPTRSVAELVFAHLLGAARHLHHANRDMPLEGDAKFKILKKSYASSTELKGKTLGIFGLGRIGTEVAKIALGLGMRVIARGDATENVPVELEFFGGQKVQLSIQRLPKTEVLQQSDFITLHLPAQKQYEIGAKEIELMKDGAGIINTARGGVLDEVALIEALEKNKLAFAALDVYEKEPRPEIQILMQPNISLSPHIGGTTLEAQERIGMMLAEQIIKEH